MSLPVNFQVPGTFVQISNAAAGAAGVENFRTLFFGQKTAAGTATENVPVRVFAGQQAGLFGIGSQLTITLDNFFANNRFGEVWAIPSEDDAGATAAVTTITVTGPATASGTLSLYVNGKLLRIGVSSGDSVADILASILATVNADPTLPITAGNATASTIDLTAKNGGSVGNQTSVAFNLAIGERFPAGVTAALAATTTGATDPDIAGAITAIPDEIFNLMVFPWFDTTSIGLFATEIDGRWDQTTQLEGHALTASFGSVNAQTTLGDSLDNEHVTVFDCGTDPVSAPYQFVGALAGVMHANLEVDPARTLKSLPLVGVWGDGEATRRTLSDRQALLTSGIATHVIRRDGSVTIDRLVTTYKTNDFGAPDRSYQDVTTMFNLSYQRQSLIAMFATRFPRYKLADDGIAFGAGQPVATPSIIKSAVIDWMRGLEAEALIEAVTDEVIAATSVERVSGNANMVRVIIAPDLINNLLIVDAAIEFRL